MKIAVAIPTRNAVRRGVWPEVLNALSRQTLKADMYLAVDSFSADDTCKQARSRGWTCWRIKPENFNHGLTRDRIVRILYRKKFDIVVFLSQDVILCGDDALARLIDFLQRNDAAGCYGRQISLDVNDSSSFQRDYFYPAESELKHWSKDGQNSLKTAFFANSFGAWRIGKVMKYGGFEAVGFGEDTLLAAKMLLNGETIGYCAEAAAQHQHPGNTADLFRRGMQIGRLHRQHPELLQNFNLRCAKQRVLPRDWRQWRPFAVKLLGYAVGRYWRI